VGHLRGKYGFADERGRCCGRDNGLAGQIAGISKASKIQEACLSDTPRNLLRRKAAFK